MQQLKDWKSNRINENSKQVFISRRFVPEMHLRSSLCIVLVGHLLKTKKEVNNSK